MPRVNSVLANDSRGLSRYLLADGANFGSQFRVAKLSLLVECAIRLGDARLLRQNPSA